MLLLYDRKKIIASSAFFVVLLGAVLFFYGLTPVAAGENNSVAFAVSPGEGFREIQDRLYHEGLIRSRIGFTVLALSSGSERNIKPGAYLLSPSMSSMEILQAMTDESNTQVVLTIREGMTVYEIDALLALQNVITPGSLIALADTERLEGKLFPDTYHFFLHSRAEDVAHIFLENFMKKTAALLPADEDAAHKVLVIASLLEAGVPGDDDRRVVAGILLKR